MRRRKFELTKCPEVTMGSYYEQKITIVTGTWKSGEEVICTARLDLVCAADLVRKLRRAMRETRNRIVQTANDAVEQAEGEL